jgi:hypothetical protein
MARKRNKQQGAPDQSGGDQAEHGMLNAMDKEGNPAGGYFRCTGIDISWQNGPHGRGDDRKEPNGAFVEDVIDACADRIRYYQGGRFASDYNAKALEHLEAALAGLRLTARVLLQNAEGCAVNHYGEDFYLHGEPGWLRDCRLSIEEAEADLINSPEGV